MPDSHSLCGLEEVQSAIVGGDISPTEVARGYLDAVRAWEPVVGAFLSLDEERLMADVRRSERRLREGTFRPLEGIGVSVKDNIDIAGQVTTAGSAWFSARATENAECWQCLESQGAMYVGKTNLHEFAFGATTINVRALTTRNPWDSSRIAGGSSGGSAVSVAVGACDASLGTDTGGSVRIPAALTGVTGFKPTFGSVSTTGALPLSPSCDHVGVFSRTALGCARLFAHLGRGGPVPLPAASVADWERDRRRWRNGLRGVRVGVLVAHLAAAEPQVAERVGQAIADLEQLGATVEPVEIPNEEDANRASGVVVRYEAAQIHRRWFRRHENAYGDDVRARLEAGFAVASAAYRKARQDRQRLTADILRSQRNVDVLVGPTTTMPAPRIDACTPPRESAPQAALLKNTYCFNTTGQPAISVPCRPTPDGLPVGLQVAAGLGRDWDVLGFAAAYQDVTRWHRSQPMLEVGTP